MAAVTAVAISAVSTGLSFIQAAEQQRNQRNAQAAAQEAMDAAKKKLTVNYTDELAIKKEPYELQREALLSQGAMAIQAGQESDRSAAATAGKVQMAQNEAQAGIRTAMGQEMTDIQKQKIAEQSRLRDLGAQIDLGTAEGAQLAARDAQEAATAAMNEGFQGVGSTIQHGADLVPLYRNKKKQTLSPSNPLPGTEQSYGVLGTNWDPMASPYSNSEINSMVDKWKSVGL